MKKYRWIVILLNLIFLLAYFNNTVAKKEELLEDGKLILLELAPVDPRSLMQGDYMQLRYKISQALSHDSVPMRGFCVVGLDSNGVATKERLQADLTPLAEGEYLIEYTAENKWSINIGAESFFFQEGQAKKYENAKYGGVKIDKEGNSLLIGLYDDQLKRIE
jgi:uncharacterized membrane-anchored protein